jgi:dihydrolipoamide dehydrogenase
LRFQGDIKKAAYLMIFEGGSKLPHSKPPCGRKNYAALSETPALPGLIRIMGMYDLIVIGAGPGGYEAAALAGRMGKKTALVEMEHIGGACLNVGCIPAKTFLRSSRLLAECKNAAAFGIEVPSAKLNLAAVVQRKNKIVAALTRSVESLLKHSKVEIIRGRARLVSRLSVCVGDEVYAARNILIATGSRPMALPESTESTAVLNPSDVFNLTELPDKIAVIGGGYVGLELACFFAAAETEVTVVEMLPQIAEEMDHDVSSRLKQALKKAGVVFKTSASIEAIGADCIVNAIGSSPALDDLDLATIGVDFDRKGIKTSDQGKTSVPGIWACGDVTGRRLLAHVATREGIVAVNNMFGGKDRIRYEAIPAVIYTHPEAAGVGKTENQLKALGIEYRKAVVPMGVAGRFLIENEGTAGIVKVLAGARHQEILGVHALGDLSSEFIVAAAQMIEMEMCAGDAAKIVFPHPTVSEALKQAILELC